MKLKILFSFLLVFLFINPSFGNGFLQGYGDYSKTSSKNVISAEVQNTTLNISLSPCTLTDSLSSTPYYCTSSYEGSATVTPSGGILPYTYSWLPGGQTTSTISGLLAGTYSVTVTDSAGCTATGNVVVATGSVIASAAPITIIAGDSTMLSAACGISASYSWSPAAYVTNPDSQNTYAHPPVTTVYTVTAFTSCGILESTVTVTVTGCTFQDSVVKSSYYCPSLAGSIQVYPYGGTLPYTYVWSPGGQTTATLTGITAGAYSVTITDGGGCNLTNAISIPTSPISFSVFGSPLYIYSGDSALISATCNIPATFSWTPSTSLTNPNSANTQAHPTSTTEYTVNITTACGIYTDSVLISINCFSLAMDSTPSFNCASSYDGTATVIPLGGVSPYTYLWTSTGGTTASISNIEPGTYTVIVFDSTGCSAEGKVTVTIKLPALTATATPPTIMAGDSTYLSATCSTGAYDYTWSPAAYATSPNSEYTYAHPPVTTIFTVIAISTTCTQEIVTYDTVVVTGCTFHDSITKTPYYCSAYSGSITVYPYGGTAPYTYQWSPGGQTTATITGLTATGYSVEITDAAGCNLTNAISSVSSASVSYSIAGNPLFIIAGDSSLLTATCNIPATYSWAPPLSVTNPNSDSTYAHPTVTTTYTVTITTACGTYIDSVPITIQCFLLNMSSTVAYYCSTSSYEGTASVGPVGGTPPYSYYWIPGAETTATITGLSPGTYTVSVTDYSGCGASNSVYVVAGSPVFTVTTNPSYIVNGDSALLVATSNVPATFSWSPSASVTYPDSSSTYAHPSSTTLYTVSITLPCEIYTYTVMVTVNCFTVLSGSTIAYCSDYGDTSIVVASGGSPPYTYFWFPGAQTSDTVFGLSAGTYSVRITDFTGCGSTVPVIVTDTSVPPPVNCSAIPPLIISGDSSYLSANCGVPATYIWSPTTGLTDPTSQNTYAQPAITTIYTVSALTICGTVTSYDTVTVSTGVYIPEISAESIVPTIFPNPSNGFITIQFENGTSQFLNNGNKILIEIYNTLGGKVFSEDNKPLLNTNSQLSLNLSELDSGIYTLRLRTNTITIVRKIVIIKNR